MLASFSSPGFVVKRCRCTFEPACWEHGMFGEFRVRTTFGRSDLPGCNGALTHGISDQKSDFLGNVDVILIWNRTKVAKWKLTVIKYLLRSNLDICCQHKHPSVKNVIYCDVLDFQKVSSLARVLFQKKCLWNLKCMEANCVPQDNLEKWTQVKYLTVLLSSCLFWNKF